ncbi:hypothetical protein GCM10010912_59180 [Paenibacillus albidus]|uniref:Uncharacterized protein n=1 Tax=Paenibacillus albidus TaxID=2041023 RepID=A0A917FUK2_9BACL|nr:hypothetical protein [Paenibacillus albidus]MBT2293258.1 hypothetical protein [Paenibacillus albidus]GGG06696.1 hypothetical protein GCM10010912_59180 [Paenibacillus albidus]
MLSQWIRRLLLPRHADKEWELRKASTSVTLTISRYQNVSQEIQEEIERNKFAKYLVYDRGDHHAND